MKAILYDGLCKAPGIPVFRPPTADERARISAAVAYLESGGAVGIMTRRPNDGAAIQRWLDSARGALAHDTLEATQ